MKLTTDRSEKNLTRDNLHASMADGATFGVMVGLGETYLAAFALAIGLGEVSAGLISSVPLLAGGIAQLISLRGVRWIGGEKRWILLGATIQGLAFFPLVFAALYGSISLGTLLLIASVYWAGGLSTGPAWNTWMESIVPRRVRPHYFACRTRVSQLTTFASFVCGGLVLHWSQNHQQTLYGFAGLFFVAGVFRFWSVGWLAMHRTPDPISPVSSELKAASAFQSETTKIRLPDLRKPAPSGGRLLAYLVVVQGFVQISSPYFAPFMLEELGYTYLAYVGLLATAFLSKVVALTWWAKIAKRHSAQTLMWIGGVSIVPLAAMWIISRNFWWLAFAQIVGGIGWAAYELGFFLLFFEALPVAQRTKMLTYYNVANTTSWCAGALIGGGILAYLGSDERAYLVLFGLSSLGRLFALGLLARTGGRPLPVRQIGLRVLGVRPNSASVDAPILPSINRDAA